MGTKVHTIYKTADGKRVPGVTTIIGILAKPALIHWAWKLGCEGQDYRKVRDKAASIGTIAHYLIQCHLRKEDPVLHDFTKADIDKAETSFLAYLEWEKRNNVKPTLVEMALVSEKYRFGGAIDLYANLNGKEELIDFKTGSGIYPEMKIQLAAYANLLIEYKYEPEAYNILHIDRETGDFTHQTYSDLSNEWEMFLHLIEVYRLKKLVWKK